MPRATKAPDAPPEPAEPREEPAAPAPAVFIPPTNTWQVADLVDAEYNPREITERQLADLTASIEDFGLVEDVVVNTHPSRHGVVVGGHQKLKILRAKGVVEVPCKEVCLELDRERELNVRLNANGGQFSARLLLGFDRGELEAWGLGSGDLEAFDKAAADFAAAQDGTGGHGPDSEFPSIDPDAETNHHCPRCLYEWN